MSNTTEKIKERLNIVDVVSQYVKLHKAGKNFKGLSPFKKEKTPSFFVSPERNAYYCFSTQKGGDIFTFVQEMEGLDFRGSLKMLADRAGVELVPENPKERNQRERLYAVLEEATKFFEEVMQKNKGAQAYLFGRALTKESIQKWRVGYAPQAGGMYGAWDKTRKYLEGLGYTTEELVQTGLIKRNEEGKEYYDQFRGRIMFPIFDAPGRAVAFSGRLFPDGADVKGPKYLNSPETALYDKSRILYGYDRAKNSIRRYNFSIIVEGQMDLVMSHQGGFPNTVAVSGTGLTEYHLDQLSRLSSNVVMAFDADSAGIASVGRSAQMALRRGMDVKVAVLPLGVDPADIIKENSEKWREAIRSAKHIVEFFLEVFSSGVKDKRKFELVVREKVLPFILAIQNKIDQAHFVAIVAEKLGMKEEPVWYELARIGKDAVTASQATRYNAEKGATGNIGENVEKGMVKNKENADSFPLLEHSRKDSLIRIITGIILSQGEMKLEDKPDGRKEDDEMNNEVDISVLRETLSAIVGADESDRAFEKYSDDQQLLFEIEVLFEGRDIEKGLEELFTDLRCEITKVSLGGILEKIRQAERGGENEAVKELMRQYQELSKHIKEAE